MKFGVSSLFIHNTSALINHFGWFNFFVLLIPSLGRQFLQQGKQATGRENCIFASNKRACILFGIKQCSRRNTTWSSRNAPLHLQQRSSSSNELVNLIKCAGSRKFLPNISAPDCTWMYLSRTWYLGVPKIWVYLGASWFTWGVQCCT